jgi:hypothetical protein
MWPSLWGQMSTTEFVILCLKTILSPLVDCISYCVKDIVLKRLFSYLHASVCFQTSDEFCNVQAFVSTWHTGMF